jgi:folate-dependent phosphoribosylglycinamide formyltransferase PurN
MYGQRVHQAVLKSGIKISGPTAHFVDERYDTGPIIAQWPVPVLPGDDAAALAGRVLRYEHRLYPSVVRALARGEVELDAAGRVRSSAAAGEDSVGFALARETGALNSIIFLG